MSSGFVVRAARSAEFLLGALFLCAAALKLANVPLFASQVMSYGVLSSPPLIAAVVLVLLPLEAALGLAMLAGLRLNGWVFYTAIAMLVFFSALVGYAWPENCGCFGPIKLGPEETLAKNGVMFLLAVLGIFVLRKEGSSEPQFGVVGKCVATLLVSGLAAYFTYDQLYNPSKYSKPEVKKPVPVAKTVAPENAVSAPAPIPAPAAVPSVPVSITGAAPVASASTAPDSAPATPASEVPAADAGDDETFPDAPTGSETYPADAPDVFKGYTVTGQDGKALDLGTGVYLVALLNATCHHCMHTVPAINALAVRPDVPTVVALVQEPDPGSLNDFVQQTGASFPILGMGNDFIKFSAFIKTAPPRFTLERDGKPLKSWEGYPPGPEELQQVVSGK